MAEKTENNNEAKVEPTMTLEKVTTVLTDLQTHINGVLQNDKKNHAGLRVQASIDDAMLDSITDELRYDFYHCVRQTAKVWGMGEHLPQRVRNSAKTQNQLNYEAKCAQTINAWINGEGNMPKLYRRPANVSKEDKAKGVEPTPRNHDDESFNNLMIDWHMRADGNDYDENATYDPVTTEEVNQ